MKKLLIALSLFCVSFGLNAQQKSTEDAKMEKFINDLLKKMTLDEKIGQMNQLNWGDISDSIKTRVRNGEIGSFLNIYDPVQVNEMQRVAIEESPNKIPLIIGRDVIHGLKTIFPIPLGQAASFNPQVVENGARVAAIESREKGITWTFAPMLDISRDARWGRIAESLGEDPYLAGELGAAMVRGFQGKSLSDPTSIAACVKHFIGYGAAEGGRDYNTTNIPIHLLRNVYLHPFQKAVEAGAATLMTSFNDNDGIPASGNGFLLKDILRNEWKFDGFVVSDWESMREMIPHGFAKDRKDVAMISANAGIDMEMVSETYPDYLKELINEGKVSMTDVDNYVRNILRVKYRLGLFTNPYVDTKKASATYSKEHLQTAREAAIQSAILLKNENVLPLKETQKIAVIGPMADAPHDQMGTWVFDGEKAHTVTPLKALQTEYKNINYVYEPVLKYSRDKNTSDFEKAKKAAESADVAVVFLGEESILSGEAHSLSNINLIGVQSELLKAVKSTGKPVVVVIMAGRPLTIERDLPYADAVLYNFHPGTMGGPAILDLLYGKANPSGKLPVTFVREVGQIPMYYNHNNTGRPPQWIPKLEDIAIEAPQTSLGNTSFYLDSGDKPLYPFGYGLSYSKFEYSNLALSTTELAMGGSLTAKVTIKNTSNVDGTEVAQLYVRDLVGSIVRPVKELKGFQRVSLKAGESKTIEFKISTDDLAFWGRDLTKKAEQGDFDLWIGTNSADGLKAKFVVK
ncbi:glycoside hydrolase family 3 N-terminal domain-containing protein [Dysgonomonas sp. 520]|uniref:glycoside hydrolase family 3 N-terminal domain-containing protein n=1 Tax=Dysgonomonas sp. 520 TaxID=2302931 RepID=UPI0013D16C82|nr:glycoside hydrolase family 3 N-terminal domain-containing protein [Dysgonomonas sp. 520]NDW10776.1 glycosyl hydrolase [Dysgonomonas sp. 520]